MFSFLHLDERLRRLMEEEIDSDIRANTLYFSSRLSGSGRRDYPDLLIEACRLHDEAWLADQLRERGRMNPTLLRAKPKGGYTTVRMPVNAPDMLAEGEFNRFYARALCRLAIEDGIPELVVYRAKQVSRPRWESECKIGSTVSAQALLDDLRAHPGTDTWLGIPAGPNSGISVCLPQL